MIQTLYTTTGIKYTSDSKTEDTQETIVYNCKFKQTDYGSVIIDRPTSPNKTIELYPLAIKHIIHSK